MPDLPKDWLKGASPADLGWLTGSWEGRMGGGWVEEHWSPLRGGALMGMFRWVDEGGVRFYELEAIEKDGDFVFLRVKHFHPGLVGWEERERAHEFVLVEADDRGAAFLEIDQPRARWAVYRREGGDRLIAYFTVGTEPDADPGVFDLARRA